MTVVIVLVPAVAVLDAVFATAVATLLAVVEASAVDKLEVAEFASCELITVAVPRGVINVGLTEFAVDALPVVTVTCDGIA